MANYISKKLIGRPQNIYQEKRQNEDLDIFIKKKKITLVGQYFKSDLAQYGTNILKWSRSLARVMLSVCGSFVSPPLMFDAF